MQCTEPIGLQASDQPKVAGNDADSLSQSEVGSCSINMSVSVCRRSLTDFFSADVQSI